MKRGLLLLGLSCWCTAALAQEEGWFDRKGKPTITGQQHFAAFGLKSIEGIDPQYPLHEAQMAGAGCVTVQFLVRPDGLTDKFVVLDSLPAGVFDAAVLQAVKFWKFEPIDHARSFVLPINFMLSARTGSHVPVSPPQCIVPHVAVTGRNVVGARKGRYPFYPPKLVKERKQGCVTVAFDIGKDHKADNYAAFDAQPDDSFLTAAAQAISDWSFDDIEPGHQGIVRFDFTIPDAGDAPTCKWPPVKNVVETKS